MDVRFAHKDDVDKFIVLKNAFLNDYGITPKSEDFIITEFEKFIKQCIVILEDEKKFVGYLLGSIESDDYEQYGYIWELFVSPAYRGKGYATLMKDKFLSYLKKKDIDLCRLDISLGKDIIKQYEKWGFKVDKYRMTLKL